MKITRNSKGLCEALFDELENLRSGDSTPQKASAVARVANTICQVTRLEMDFARFVASDRAENSALASLPMGIEQK